MGYPRGRPLAAVQPARQPRRAAARRQGPLGPAAVGAGGRGTGGRRQARSRGGRSHCRQGGGGGVHQAAHPDCCGRLQCPVLAHRLPREPAQLPPPPAGAGRAAPGERSWRRPACTCLYSVAVCCMLHAALDPHAALKSCPSIFAQTPTHQPPSPPISSQPSADQVPTHPNPTAPPPLQVRAFRVLEQPPPANGVVVAAPTFGQLVSDKLRVPRARQARFHVPRYCLPEVESAADYFVSEVLAGHAGGRGGGRGLGQWVSVSSREVAPLMLRHRIPQPGQRKHASPCRSSSPPCRVPTPTRSPASNSSLPPPCSLQLHRTTTLCCAPSSSQTATPGSCGTLAPPCWASQTPRWASAAATRPMLPAAGRTTPACCNSLQPPPPGSASQRQQRQQAGRWAVGALS